jgi:hypothetical protein
MSKNSIYYTYYSYEEWGRGYIGYRKCPYRKTPETDEYFGSFKDKTFKPTVKEILGVYNSKDEAIRDEITLHKFFDVAKNPHFANRACQTSTKFSYNCSGKIFSQEHRRKISQANMGKIGAWRGRKHSEKTQWKPGKKCLKHVKVEYSQKNIKEKYPNLI